jgi:hypothetical protein
MKPSSYSRRNFIRNTGSGLGLFPFASLSRNPLEKELSNKKIVSVGAHPDDPESITSAGILPAFMIAVMPPWKISVEGNWA